MLLFVATCVYQHATTNKGTCRINVSMLTVDAH